MARLWILSDLHYEFYDALPTLDVPDADICVCAGDVTNRGIARSLGYLAEQVGRHMPVVFVPGNHEFYRAAIVESLHEARQMRLPGVHWLDDSAVVLHGIRFVGGTLWTDYMLGGGREWNMHAAESMMNDYRAIAYSKHSWRRLTPNHLAEMHRETRSAIDTYLSVPFDGPTVVVTHHAPHPRSIHPRYQGSSLNASFASDLSPLIERHQPALWVHGHMHDPSDYTVGRTRIVANPAGYPGENPLFDPTLVIEV